MERSQSKYLAMSFGLLITISVGLFFMTREEQGPEIDRTYFSIDDTEKIDHVQLISSMDTIDLSYDGAHWRINGRWNADVQMIKVLMATLMQAQPQRPVAAAMTDTVRKQLEKKGTRVILSEAGISRMTFTAGGNAAKSESWFLKEKDNQPFVMIIPGYRVYVSGILQLAVGGWRDKRIFDFNWRNFKSLTAIYPKEPVQGFNVEMKQRYFGIREVPKSDTTKLNDYLDAVSLLLARRFVIAGETVADSITRLQPVARIEIRDIADRMYGIDLFAPRRNDMEVFGKLTDGEVVTLDREAVTAIVRRRGYFVAEDR